MELMITFHAVTVCVVMGRGVTTTTRRAPDALISQARAIIIPHQSGGAKMTHFYLNVAYVNFNSLKRKCLNFLAHVCLCHINIHSLVNEEKRHGLTLYFVSWRPQAKMYSNKNSERIETSPMNNEADFQWLWRLAVPEETSSVSWVNISIVVTELYWRHYLLSLCHVKREKTVIGPWRTNKWGWERFPVDKQDWGYPRTGCPDTQRIVCGQRDITQNTLTVCDSLALFLRVWML